MRFHVFDLLYTDPAQVREFLISMTKEGLVGGVYLWINRVNGKMYVGSSINLYPKMSRYFTNNAHGIIGQALLKYGLEGFVLVIFLVPDASPDLVLALEQSVLDGCVCVYNISPTAKSPAGVKHSEESKAKISAALKGKRSALKGRKRSDETKAKISAAMKAAGHPNYGKNLSDEHKAKISAKNTKPVYLYAVHHHGVELQSTHYNAVMVAEILGIPRATLYSRIRHRTLFEFHGASYIASAAGLAIV